jgi:hypothetical protein
LVLPKAKVIKPNEGKIVFRKYICASLVALIPLCSATLSLAESPVAQWQDTQSSLPQALASIDPADYTEAQYGCHAYLLKTDDIPII